MGLRRVVGSRSSRADEDLTISMPIDRAAEDPASIFDNEASKEFEYRWLRRTPTPDGDLDAAAPRPVLAVSRSFVVKAA